MFGLTIAYDVAPWLNVGLSIGGWTFGDRTVGVAGADSTFEMVPVIATVRFAVPLRRIRLYAGAGAGHSFNTYHLGPNHRQHMLDSSIPSYDVDASGGGVLHVLVGCEGILAKSGRIGLALEAVSVQTQTELVEYSDGVIFSAATSDVDVSLLRARLALRF